MIIRDSGIGQLAGSTTKRTGTSEPSANDDRFAGATVVTVEEAEEHAWMMLDPPADFGCKPAALVGLGISLENLSVVQPGAECLSGLIGPAIPEASKADCVAMKAEAVAAFSKRKKYHFQYLSALHLGLQSRLATPEVWQRSLPLSQILGAWAVRRKLDGWTPTKYAQARVLSALSNPDSSASRSWKMEQRQRAAGDAVHELRIAISRNRAAAEALGLVVSDQAGLSTETEIEAFNFRFRRRMSDLLEYKTADGQAGAGGNGTLSPAGLKCTGRELMTAIRVGRREEIHVSIEVVSHLTSDHVQLLPVQLKSCPPPGALAWLDVPRGSYFHTLHKLVERGARPDQSTESLYEVTTQVVEVRLSPPLADALRRAARDLSGDFCAVAELLGEVAHGPYAVVAGVGPYSTTASKLQASLPALLLQEGEFRWAVAVTTSSPHVLSRGRPAYGVGRQASIDRVTDHVYDLLGWPRSGHESDPAILVGSFTTPKLLAVRLALSALAQEADAWTVAADSVEDVINCVNAHASYLAMLLALVYALRDRVIYKIPTRGLRAGLAIKINDKDIHEFSMPAVPTLRLVHEAVVAWEELLRDAIKALREIGTEDAMRLAGLIDARLNDHESVGWIFRITVAHTLEPVGTHSWRDRLPPGLRLVGNFGRQFWPHRLADHGICQLDADILLRHQMPALHPCSSHICRPEAEIHSCLIQAMTDVLERQMDLPVPQALRPRSSS